ncbi:hypothetical protein G5I_11766 [Acromyrmex echinatior]|uniref:Uncharacterized protein n=1 Tax=Acromyrmex echinatior TaxID=103372 RepID=F4X0I7_ACREC|nr:hypothetical protein G5I_11766 [Acromyrmex echinatior]
MIYHSSEFMGTKREHHSFYRSFSIVNKMITIRFNFMEHLLWNIFLLNNEERQFVLTSTVNLLEITQDHDLDNIRQYQDHRQLLPFPSQSLKSRQKPKDVNTMTQQSIPEENTGIHSYHNIDKQAPRNQDQQRTMQQSVAAENVTISSYNDDTNWQAVGYQIDQQRMMHQFVMAENVATSSHNDDTNWLLDVNLDLGDNCIRRDGSQVRHPVLELQKKNDRKFFDIILSYVGNAKDQVLVKYVQSSTIFTLRLNYSSNTRTYFIVENIFEVYSLKAGRAEGRRTPQCSFSEFEDGLLVPADIRFNEATARGESLEGAIKVHYFNNRTDSSELAASDDRKQHPLAAGQAEARIKKREDNSRIN